MTVALNRIRQILRHALRINRPTRRRGALTLGFSQHLECRQLLSASTASANATTAVQIVDNGDAGYSTTGDWTTYTPLGRDGDWQYNVKSNKPATASWSFSNLTPGQYRVSTTWGSNAAFAANAQYTIRDTAGGTVLGSALLNQQQDPNDFTDQGSAWEDVKTVTITGSTLVVDLSNAGTDPYIIADAVRIERLGDLASGPEITVLDGGTDLQSGAASVNFGTAAVGQPVSRTFTIQNVGTSNLTLQPAVVPAGFTITSNFSTNSVAPGGTASLTVRLDAAAIGTYTGTVSFGTNDSNENPFQFTVTGAVAATPVVQIIDNGDAGYSTTGDWTTYTPLGRDGDWQYNVKSSKPATATWSFSNLTPGQYRVSTTWGSNAAFAANAQYTIRDTAGGTVLGSALLNQKQDPNDFTDQGSAWEDVKTVTITGSTLVVDLTNAGTDPYLIADAVRIERIPTAPPTTGPVAPFWMKQGSTPTLAPSWYSNTGAVTKQVFYDSSKTPAQNGAALVAALQNLQAGDHVLIHGGNYAIDSFFQITATGTDAAPITIEGAPGESVVLSQSTSAQNVIEFDQSHYIIVKGLTLTGGSKGLRVHTVDHFMMVNCKVYGTASGAVSANSGNTSFLYFVDNEIYNTGGHGEGFYIGLDASTFTHDTWIVGNYIHDLNGPTVNQGDGIEVKYGSYRVDVKWNYIARTNYPGITMYGTGRPASDNNIVEENVVLFSNDNAIQISSDAIVRDNLVVTNGTAFYSKPENTNPQNLSVINNTFVTQNTALKTAGWDLSAGGLVLANNALYSGTGSYIPNTTGSAQVAGNVFVSDLSKAFVNLKLDGSALDATPIAGSSLIAAAQPTFLPTADLWDRTRITAADAGAVDYRA